MLGLELLAILLLALAVSIDGFAAGLSLGLKKIPLSILPLTIISITSALAIFLCMLLGNLLAQAISFQGAQLLGAFILLLIGGVWIKGYFFPKKEGRSIFKITLLGIIIEIRREPLRADLDSSGKIDAKEAYLLGFALAMDAAGVGLGASLLGLNLFLIPLAVGIQKFLLLQWGAFLGVKYGGLLGEGLRELLPGFILILLGLVQLISLLGG